MSKNQKAPLLAFVLVAIVCSLIVLDAVRSSALDAQRGPAAQEVVRGASFVRVTPVVTRRPGRPQVTRQTPGRAPDEQARVSSGTSLDPGPTRGHDRTRPCR